MKQKFLSRPAICSGAVGCHKCSYLEKNIQKLSPQKGNLKETTKI